MQSRTRIGAQPSCGDDGGITGRKHEPDMVSRWEWAQPASSIKLCRYRRCFCDCAWQQHGDSMSHGEGSDGAHGMPSHQLGVGDIDEMHSRTRIEAYRSFGHDSEITGRQHEPGLVSRCEWAQLACSIQQCRDRRGVCDGAR